MRKNKNSHWHPPIIIDNKDLSLSREVTALSHQLEILHNRIDLIESLLLRIKIQTNTAELAEYINRGETNDNDIATVDHIHRVTSTVNEGNQS